MTNYVSLGRCWDWLQKRYVFLCCVVADVLPLRLKNWLKLIAYSKHTWQFEMNIYTHLSIFCYSTLIVFIFSVSYISINCLIIWYSYTPMGLKSLKMMIKSEIFMVWPKYSLYTFFHLFWGWSHSFWAFEVGKSGLLCRGNTQYGHKSYW